MDDPEDSKNLIIVSHWENKIYKKKQKVEFSVLIHRTAMPSYKLYRKTLEIIINYAVLGVFTVVVLNRVCLQN